MAFILHKVCLDLDSCFVFVPIQMSKRDSYIPALHLGSIEFVIFPINFDNTHWVIAVVRIDRNQERILATLYDPLVNPEYQGLLLAIWESFCLPFLHRWFERDVSSTAFPTDATIEMLDTPKQRDTFNCGVLGIAHASSYVNESMYLEQFSEKRMRFRDRIHLKKETLQALLLRMLWKMVYLSTENKYLVSEIQATVCKVQEISEELTKFCI